MMSVSLACPLCGSPHMVHLCSTLLAPSGKVEDCSNQTGDEQVSADNNRAENLGLDNRIDFMITAEKQLNIEDRLDFRENVMSCYADSPRYVVIYLGHSYLNWRFPPEAAMPWVMAEMKCSRNTFKEVQLEVQPTTLGAIAYDGKDVTEPVFEHNLHFLSRFAKSHADPRCFAYLYRQSVNGDFECHVFLAHNEKVVPELFQSIRSALQHNVGDEMLHNRKPLETAKACYEVLYIGRAKIKSKKIQSTHIDDLVVQLEAKDNQTSQTTDKDVHSDRRRHKSDSSVQSLPNALDENSVQENELQKFSEITIGKGVEMQNDSPLGSNDGIHQPFSGANLEHSSSSDHLSDGHSSAENLIINLNQSNSADQLKDMFFGLQNHHESQSFEKQDSRDNQMKTTNRAMLFRIGTSKISLISLDKKQTIIERKFKNISSVSQGIVKSDVFGFISRESDNQLICHLLRCCSNILVDEIMNALRTSFQNAYVQRLQTKPICFNCPLQQYSKLCQDINGLNAENAYNLLSNRIQQLPEKDASDLYYSLKNDNPQSYEESVELLMVSLRKLCEHKQKDHMHISDSSKGPNKNEFFLVDMKGKTNQRSAFDFFRPRAKKKSLILIESLFMSVHKTGDVKVALPNRGSTNDVDLDSSLNQDPSTKDNKKFDYSSPPPSPRVARPRSATLGAIPNVNTLEQYFAKQVEKQKAEELDLEKQQAIESPMKHMFNLAMSSSPHRSSSGQSSDATESQKTPDGNLSNRGSWRQNIFKQVVTPTKPLMASAVGESTDKLAKSATKRTHDELKAMWKKAIMETRLLIRMERENQDLRARQDKMYLKRQKLDYAEITPCLKDVTRTWEEMLNTPNRQANKFEPEELLNCVKQGVPQSKRGDIWWLLVEQHRLQYPDIERETPKVDYTELLKQLTTHQHSILIDLGRTFPGHPYFSVQLGNGQLALFNLLKAYSLMDQDVGYCQGLSFVAGILLMHMEETAAFEAWKHLMYNLDLRKQYRQNMVALQIQLYQLTRLIHDNYKDLYDHFEKHEIAPTLYAAPWFLTLFSSQFPLGFVARVFDLLFMQGKEVIFKVALVLLGNHKELILQCDSFETVVEFIKTTLPAMGMIQMERVINQVFDLDISKQLQAYQVEYHVLKEEMMYAHHQHDDDTLEKLELSNCSLRQQNTELVEKLERAHNQIKCQEIVIQDYQMQDDKFKSHIQMLERERSALVDAVLKLKQFVVAEKLTSEFDLSALAPSMFVSPLNCSSRSENSESQDSCQDSREGHHKAKIDSDDGHFLHSKKQDKINTVKEEVSKVQGEVSKVQGEDNTLQGEVNMFQAEVIIDQKLGINKMTVDCLKSARYHPV